MTIVLQITPQEFSASAGKLNSNNRYIRKSSTPLFYFISTRNMDVSGGGLRYVNATGTSVTDNTYTGSFSVVPGIGVRI